VTGAVTEPPQLPRDRDAAGRPRNRRPRDELGRPLARAASGPAPVDDPALPPAAALARAQQLIDTGHPFQAHEVLEAVWKAAPATERELWRGLAQIAVGLTHAQRGNQRGAAALLRRGAAAVAQAAPDPPDGIDAAGVARAAGDLASQITGHGLTGLPPGALRISLLGP
jgi:hypothetical protein